MIKFSSILVKSKFSLDFFRRIKFVSFLKNKDLIFIFQSHNFPFSLLKNYFLSQDSNSNFLLSRSVYLNFNKDKINNKIGSLIGFSSNTNFILTCSNNFLFNNLFYLLDLENKKKFLSLIICATKGYFLNLDGFINPFSFVNSLLSQTQTFYFFLSYSFYQLVFFEKFINYYAILLIFIVNYLVQLILISFISLLCS